ncbi:MAG TPA: FTR1 family protein, partial [Patescibacteria group bacterium]|nr:FTR1 family protein [Patescibacteria group bacterium]
MLPSFLITIREVIEASLIVATILGILVKLGMKNKIRTVWYATASALGLCLLLLAAASIAGLRIQELYTGRTEELIEGVLMIISALFITWAVFFLHTYFAQYKTHLLSKIKSSVETGQSGLFMLVFTAVFREGFEIVLFLSTIYLSSNPGDIFLGFSGGMLAGLLISAAFFTATLRMPVYYAFRFTSIMLILFAAGLLGRGVHEFAEAGLIPETMKLTAIVIPDKSTLFGGVMYSMFGIAKHMEISQLTIYVA